MQIGAFPEMPIICTVKMIIISMITEGGMFCAFFYERMRQGMLHSPAVYNPKVQ